MGTTGQKNEANQLQQKREPGGPTTIAHPRMRYGRVSDSSHSDRVMEMAYRKWRQCVIDGSVLMVATLSLPPQLGPQWKQSYLSESVWAGPLHKLTVMRASSPLELRRRPHRSWHIVATWPDAAEQLLWVLMAAAGTWPDGGQLLLVLMAGVGWRMNTHAPSWTPLAAARR